MKSPCLVHSKRQSDAKVVCLWEVSGKETASFWSSFAKDACQDCMSWCTSCTATRWIRLSVFYVLRNREWELQSVLILKTKMSSEGESHTYHFPKCLREILTGLRHPLVCALAASMGVWLAWGSFVMANIKVNITDDCWLVLKPVLQPQLLS